MTSILVTGATTPLGERLIQRLLDDARVDHVLAVGLDRPAPDRSGLGRLRRVSSRLDRSGRDRSGFAGSETDDAEAVSAGGRSLFRLDARLVRLEVDLTRPRQIRQLLYGPARDLEVRIVVHLAQHRAVCPGGREVHLQNVEALRSVLDMADGHPTIRRVVVRSFAEVYKVGIDLPVLTSEDHPLDLSADTSQYVRDRVEADLTACSRMGVSDCEVVVLRCAEALEAGTGSQLYDYLEAPLALRPAGYDPMVNVATTADLVEAFHLACFSEYSGVYNIPGRDTLPLSGCLHAWGTPSIALPGSLVRPAYRLKHRLLGSNFSYTVNQRRLHYGQVLNGARARLKLGYVPRHPVSWPMAGSLSSEEPGEDPGAGPAEPA